MLNKIADVAMTVVGVCFALVVLVCTVLFGAAIAGVFH